MRRRIGEVPSEPLETEESRCLDGLSRPARHLVEIGAVLGDRFTVADVAEIQGQPVGGLMAAVHEAVDAGAVALTPNALGFPDADVRQAAYDEIPSALLLALHRQIGERCVQRQEWEAAARHLMMGAEPGDRLAAAGLERVAREVRTLAPELASELALRALGLTGADDIARFARASTAVTNLITAGRLAEADYLARRALGSHGVTAAAAAPLHLALAELLLFSGRPEAAVEEIRPVLSDPAVPAASHAGAELSLLWARLALDDRAGVGTQVEAILSGGDGRDESLPPALAALGVLSWHDGRVADGLALARSAVLRGDRQPHTSGGPFGRFSLASMLTSLGDLEEAAQHIEMGREEITSCGETLWSAAPAVAASRVHLAAGRIDDASASAHEAIELATELGTSCFLAAASAVLAELALMRGELAEAAAHVERSRRRSNVAWPPWGVIGPRLVEAMVTEVELGPDGVLARVADLYDNVTVNARVLLDDPRRAPWLVRVALAAGERERAQRVLTQAERLAALNDSFPAVVSACLHAQGLYNADPGMVQQAVAAHRGAGAQASAWEDAGALLVDTGDRSAAKALLERAVVAYEELGAERDAARVRARLRALGVQWKHGNRAERPVSGWDSLTDAERAVAELVAEGLTNGQVAERMYLSRHTVDFNLRQIFRKLGIRSRVTLARLYLERGPGTDANDHASV